MSSNRLLSYRARKHILTVAMAAALLLIFAGVSLAALYNIDTDDMTVDEWNDQGLPLFQADLSGDTEAGYAGESESDIINTWVATSEGPNPKRLAFLMEVAAEPALAGDSIQGMAIAALDCDQDGSATGAGDLLIGYAQSGDTVWLVSGDLNQGGVVGSSDDGDPTLGQTVDEFVEWGVPVSYLKIDKPLINWYADCTGSINIGFATVDLSEWPLATATIDETSPLTGWNVPTAVQLQGIDVSETAVATSTALIIVGLMMASAVIIAMARRSQKSK